ncbi:MAG: MoxR family ATPase [Firmicutes bacterium]|nr:MoxR family ATPase [Bacillota bacterium]
MNEMITAIEAEAAKAILGKEEIIRKVLTVIIAGGHILLEDIPGVGKTTLALAFSKAMDLKFNRVQFTPDVVPSDITGFTVYNKDSGGLMYRPGAAMCNILLADEINRTSSKTQSSLLEVMQEGSITVDGRTRKVPEPFVVIATQNPIGTAGTQMLPEAQLDRFMVQLSIGYPDEQSEINILKDRKQTDPLKSILKVAGAEDILAMRQEAKAIFIHDRVYQYITALCRKTREHPLIRLGISPRGALSLTAMAQAWTYIHGREFVIPQDVRDVFPDIARHRLMLSSKANVQSLDAAAIIDEILRTVPWPDVRKSE